jgi:hypothetical protein
VIEKLDYNNDRVYASVLVTYSTQQPRGSVLVDLTPEEKVLSYTTRVGILDPNSAAGTVGLFGRAAGSRPGRRSCFVARL